MTNYDDPDHLDDLEVAELAAREPGQQEPIDTAGIRSFTVTVVAAIWHHAMITVEAASQTEADEVALDLFHQQVFTEGAASLGLPEPWDEQEPHLNEPVIDMRFRCVDCGKNTGGGEYYMVDDQLWAAAGMDATGGMLCLADLERRIGRPLTADDFTAVMPSREAWERHVTEHEKKSNRQTAVVRVR